MFIMVRAILPRRLVGLVNNRYRECSLTTGVYSSFCLIRSVFLQNEISGCGENIRKLAHKLTGLSLAGCSVFPLYLTRWRKH